MSAKKVLVTGASGFLGSHICEAVHEAGYEVHALLRDTSSTQWLGHEWIKIHRADFLDREALSTILNTKHAVIHAAAALIGSPEEELYRVNVEGTRTLAEQSINAGLKRFIFISSNAAGGPSSTLAPRKESDPDHPLSPYGRSKNQAEQELSGLVARIKIINLRPVVIYGPRDRHLVRLFKLVDSPITPLLGIKPLYLPMVHVKDVAQAAVAALQTDVPSGSTYYISDGAPYTFDVICDMMAHALGKKLQFIRIPIWLASLGMRLFYGGKKKEIAFTPGSVREFRYRFRLVSNEKAQKELGWQPEVMLSEGFAETVEWYRDRGWL